MISRILPTFLMILVAMLLGGFLLYFSLSKLGFFGPDKVETMDSSILMEKIERVYKLIVVEGEFVDVVSYKSFEGWDIPGFRKKALLKVKAKVSVGYDMNQLKITFDEPNKIVNISNLPEPQILSIDSDISYYDLDEGIFNAFTPEELTQINKAAKDTIRNNANKSSLMQVAKNQAGQMFSMVTFLAQSEGWKVVVDKDLKKRFPDLPDNIKNPPLNNNTLQKTP